MVVPAEIYLAACLSRCRLKECGSAFTFPSLAEARCGQSLAASARPSTCCILACTKDVCQSRITSLSWEQSRQIRSLQVLMCNHPKWLAEIPFHETTQIKAAQPNPLLYA